MTVDPQSLDERTVVASTLYAEARGEFVPGAPQHDGYMAVASVLLNRADAADAYFQRTGRDHPIFGDSTLKGACLQARQFSCWNADDPQRPGLMALRRGTNFYFDLALDVADVTLSDADQPDPTFGATHYLTREAFVAAPAGHWCRSPTMVHTVDILHHKFFRQA